MIAEEDKDAIDKDCPGKRPHYVHKDITVGLVYILKHPANTTDSTGSLWWVAKIKPRPHPEIL